VWAAKRGLKVPSGGGHSPCGLDNELALLAVFKLAVGLWAGQGELLGNVERLVRPLPELHHFISGSLMFAFPVPT
jgi:hypothetical protein